ncbi:uncharacterized protein MELLADRAFT_88616 [Melampsora larici-populina 98AG31]|uniref:Alpha-type protein kinase domain-containing protein n=1 Tax=Melampsora larici-populina (strain 98AG31 / pathotype 3-4-7) TaxID=747676 RepID=F4RSD2_MELLP|nr:uncharacterized protein MELLADRAFT_88616 [Melampsora larici-populina 98AG31]EGG04713.1 hypothetical protein MELLADRAFT_88616 [Melampsora larici-populina 98AG31]
MVGNPYIGARYRQIPSHPTLPLPAHKGLVGLACPECPAPHARSLVYLSDNEEKDTVNVKCPNTTHYYRTFKLNQLIHKIGCINAGAPYPISFDLSAYGPPVNIRGLPVAPRTSPNESQSKTFKQPKRAGPGLECTRPTIGPTANKHKKAGHAGFIDTPPVVPRSTFTSAKFDEMPVVPKRPKVLPAQCAQSIGRVGRVLTDDGMLVLTAARLKHAEAGTDSPVISHFFEEWPVAILNSCQSLLREAQAAAGTNWKGQLLVWEESIHKWREIPVNLPHRYTQTSRNLVLCVPNQRAYLTDEVRDVLEGLGMGKPVVPRSSTPSGPAAPASVVQVTSTTNRSDGDPPDPEPRSTSYTPPSGQAPVNLELDSDTVPPKQLEPPQPAPMPSTPESLHNFDDLYSHLDPALFGQVDKEVEGYIISPSHFMPQQTQGAALKEWPGEDTLVSSLLAWYTSAGVPPRRKARISLWIKQYGSNYTFHDKTVYRYAAWVDLVGLERMQAWVNQWPEAGTITSDSITVAWTRRNFQKEFNMDLGWKALPFDQPEDNLVSTNNKDKAGLRSNRVFGLAERGGITRRTPDALKYKWACTSFNIDVDQNNHRFSWDGRYTYPAVWHKGANNIPLDACALHPRKDNIHNHMRFAQMYAHAECLLQKFIPALFEQVEFTGALSRVLCHLHIVQNFILFNAKGSNISSTRWFNLREKVESTPAFITSDFQFGPLHRAPNYLGRFFECFTHWTYEYHHHQALIYGFRGDGSVITDLAMEDNTRDWFLQNPSTAGLQVFASTHECNHFCRSLGMTPPPPYYPVESPPVNPED